MSSSVLSRSGVANLLGYRDPDGDEDQQHNDLLHRNSPQWSSPERLDPNGIALVNARHPRVLFEERLRAAGRAWWWLLVIVVVTFFTIGLLAVPIAILAWLVNVGRFRRTVVRVDAERLWVGRRSARLVALDLATVGRATNPWPWRVFNSRHLGANPIWTRDSVGLRGRDGSRKYWVAIGTNRREEFLEALERGVADARERSAAAARAYAGQTLPPPGWYDDPRDLTRLRWWDGVEWTGYDAARPASGGRGTTSGSAAP